MNEPLPTTNVSDDRRPGGRWADFLAITGATSVGKTRLSLALARELPLEVVSMDSRQVYRRMDIGTGKATDAERRSVPHWGLDLVDPEEAFSAGRFAREARSWIADIRARGRLPVLVGGTGFFLRALTDPVFLEPPLDPARRGRLRDYLRRRAPEELAAWVRILDPKRAEVAGGRQRLGRTLEMALLTGRPLSWWHRRAPPEAPPLTALVVHLELGRSALYRRIDRRVVAMIEAGLEDEVRSLLASGCTRESIGMTAVGYREMARLLWGEEDLSETVRSIQRATRRYARRQITWFRNQLPPETLRLDAGSSLDELVGAVLPIAKLVRTKP